MALQYGGVPGTVQIVSDPYEKQRPMIVPLIALDNSHLFCRFV